MAYTVKLDMGYPISLVQNQVYALPNVAVTIFATAACNVANDTGMTSPYVLPAATGTIPPQKISGGFIACTSATNCIVTLRRD